MGPGSVPLAIHQYLLSHGLEHYITRRPDKPLYPLSKGTIFNGPVVIVVPEKINCRVKITTRIHEGFKTSLNTFTQ